MTRSVGVYARLCQYSNHKKADSHPLDHDPNMLANVHTIPYHEQIGTSPIPSGNLT